MRIALSLAKQGIFHRELLHLCTVALGSTAGQPCFRSGLSQNLGPSEQQTSSLHSFRLFTSSATSPPFHSAPVCLGASKSQLQSLSSTNPFLSTSHGAGSYRGFFDVSQAIQNLKYDFADPNRSYTNSVIFLNIAAWIASCINPGILNRFAQSSYAIAQGEWWRLLTASFLHGGITHLGLNMLGVHLLAPPVEMACGRTVFLLIYCLSGVGGGLAHQLMGSSAYILGSSGAIAGLFTAYVVYKWRNRDYIGFTEQDKSWVMQMVGFNVLLGLAFSGSLAHLAHIGGAVSGALTMWAFGPRFVREWGRVIDKPIIPLPKSLQ